MLCVEECKGKKCIKGKTVDVHKSPAGLYLGVVDEEGPYCRCSEYFKEGAEWVNDREYAMEIEYCNFGKGCQIGD